MLFYLLLMPFCILQVVVEGILNFFLILNCFLCVVDWMDYYYDYWRISPVCFNEEEMSNVST